MSSETTESSMSIRTQAIELVAWCTVFLLPWLVFDYFQRSLNDQQAMFLALVSGAVVMWIFRLVPDFVPGLLLITLVSLLSIAPHEVAFSGFYSQIFFLVMGIFVLAALLSESCWIERLELALAGDESSVIKRVFTLIAAGFALTLVVPSPLGRATMVKPLVDRFISTNANNNTLVLLAQIHGSTLLSTVFLTGNPLNFILLALMSEQTQSRFYWLGWLQASFLVMLILSVALMISLLVLNLRFKTVEKSSGIKKTNAMRNITPKDWGVLALYGVFIGSVLTQSAHQVPLAWVVVLLALAIFSLGGLSVDSLRRKVDWPTLLFIATVVAWGNIIEYIGLAEWFSHQTSYLETAFLSSFYIGLTMMILTVIVLRFIIPGAPAFILLSATLMPFADVIGVSPWIIGFIVLTVSESFILPYQHGVFSQAISEAVAQKIPIRYGVLIQFNIWITLLKVFAIYASIPLWQALNFI